MARALLLLQLVNHLIADHFLLRLKVSQLAKLRPVVEGADYDLDVARPHPVVLRILHGAAQEEVEVRGLVALLKNQLALLVEPQLSPINDFLAMLLFVILEERKPDKQPVALLKVHDLLAKVALVVRYYFSLD